MTMKTLELPKIDEALIRRVQERVVERFDPDAIYLFGSAARGEARHGSDLDLLVVMKLPRGTSPLDMSRRIRSEFRGWRLPLDIVVVEPDVFTERQAIPGDVSRIAVEDGRRLHGLLRQPSQRRFRGNVRRADRQDRRLGRRG